MKKIKYRYNTSSLRYEKIEETWFSVFQRIFGFLCAAIVFSVIIVAFAFKYFQVIETRVTLPDGFTPERFEISTDIYKYNKKRGNYSTAIKWQEAFTEAE